MNPIEALERAFGAGVEIEPVQTADRMGRRVRGVDLSKPLAEAQAAALLGLLDHFHLVTFPEQDTLGFGLDDLERVGCHFGAVITHPKNYANYREKGAKLRLLPEAERAATRSNAAFPDEIRCLDGADRPSIYVVTNLVGGGPGVTPESAGGQHWHTDIEFEPIPLSTSLFYSQRAPTRRDGRGAFWTHNPPRQPGFYHPDSDPVLAERREAMPLNGETAYTDTAAAFAALPPEEQASLRETTVRRRLRREDPGWLIPLVYRNPRSGIESLHSSVWASRGKNVAPAQIEGLCADESRAFFDRLETHCLAPEFRYDHPHRPGDVTIWSNFATLHTAPPVKRIIDDPDDARLLYRISVKGQPSLTLPRSDTDAWLEANLDPPYRSPA